MAALMREIAAESDVGGGGLGDADGKTGPQTDQEKTFREAWEKMLVEGMNGSLDVDALETPGDSKGKTKASAPVKDEAAGSTSTGKDDAFQESIRKAMNKLKESETNLQVSNVCSSYKCVNSSLLYNTFRLNLHRMLQTL